MLFKYIEFRNWNNRNCEFEMFIFNEFAITLSFVANICLMIILVCYSNILNLEIGIIEIVNLKCFYLIFVIICLIILFLYIYIAVFSLLYKFFIIQLYVIFIKLLKTFYNSTVLQFYSPTTFISRFFSSFFTLFFIFFTIFRSLQVF